MKAHSPRLVTVALTGGPCGGKTTALARIQQSVEERGVPVVLVHETATEMISSGLTPARLNAAFQARLMNRLLQTEDFYRACARELAAETVLVVCDRGAMDAKAYVEESVWLELLHELCVSEVDLRERRYDGVLHLQSAAVGAEQFYTCENNAARRETAEQARALDERTLRSWLGHPHLRIIANNTVDFSAKVRRATEEVCHLLGIPQPLEIERKYLVRPFDLKQIPVPCNEFRIVQTYLHPRDTGEERRIRARGHQDAWIYYETIKRAVPGGSRLTRVETERIITEHEYLELSHEQDVRRQTIRKRRTTFIWDNRCFELDVFERPRKGLYLLEVELGSTEEHVQLPPFLKVVKDVTEDPEYRNAAIAAGV